MSVDRHGDERPLVRDDAVSAYRPPRSIASDRLETADATAFSDSSDLPRSAPLPVQIERTRLELRIEALERALETSERRRQTVIDRYERLLAERTATPDAASADDRSESVLTRLALLDLFER